METFHLATRSGPRMAVLHRARGPARGAVLYAPPFAEEMNKSRRMATLQAAAFAQAGFATLIVDPLGTGDSPGDYEDASWSTWTADLEDAAEWLHREFRGSLWIWGLRSGCLLASALRNHGPSGSGYLFWQPVISGRTYLQQFLRMKVVGDRTAATDAGTSTVRSLRELIAAGRSLEVGGYTLSAGLATGLEQAELIAPPPKARIVWIEVTSSEAGSLNPASHARIEAWRASGCAIEAEAVHGLQFWQTQETTECPALLARTIALVASGSTAAAQ